MPSVLFRTDGYIRSIRDSDSSVKQFENVTKRLTIGSVDPENVARYQAKLREWEDKLSISGKMVDNAQKTGRLCLIQVHSILRSCCILRDQESFV